MNSGQNRLYRVWEDHINQSSIIILTNFKVVALLNDLCSAVNDLSLGRSGQSIINNRSYSPNSNLLNSGMIANRNSM